MSFWVLRIAAVAVAVVIRAGSARAQAQDITDGISNFYLTQGVLGVSCAVLGVALIFLWRAREKEMPCGVLADLPDRDLSSEDAARLWAHDRTVGGCALRKHRAAVRALDILTTVGTR